MTSTTGTPAAMQRCAALLPAVAEAAHRVGAKTIGLIDVSCAAPSSDSHPNLGVDQVFTAYSNGQTLGTPTAPTHLVASVVGPGTLPQRPFPQVTAHIAATSTSTSDPLGLRAALSLVPDDALTVVITTWALSQLPADQRLAFLHHLTRAGASQGTGHAVAWVSVEGVGVAPGISTLGDRPASGHSIIGLAIFEHHSMRTQAVGRCWSRGRWLSWIAQG